MGKVMIFLSICLPKLASQITLFCLLRELQLTQKKIAIKLNPNPAGEPIKFLNPPIVGEKQHPFLDLTNIELNFWYPEQDVRHPTKVK